MNIERLQTLAAKAGPCDFIRDHPDDLVIRDPDGSLILKDVHNLVTHLSVDPPAKGKELTELAVGADGKVALSGLVKKGMKFLDASVGTATATKPALGETGDIRILLNTWKISLRPAKLGTQDLCVRAQFLKKVRGHVFQPVQVVDRIAPSNVRGLSVSNLTDKSATLSWDAATDNFGLAGYEVTVDGAAPQRVSSRTYRVTGLDASSSHTASVVAVDDAGNKSGAPATTNFTTKAPPPPPPPPNSGPVTVTPENGSAIATWRPGANDATYAISLDGEEQETSPFDRWCFNDAGQPAAPCTTNDTIRYPLRDLESDTPYTFTVAATPRGGGAARTETADFRTTVTPPTVPDSTIQQIASESRQCTGAGGSFYLAPSRRGQVTVPAGARTLFAGCYKAADSSCVDKKLPAEEDGKLDCSDDVTDLVRSVAPPGQGPTIDGLAGTLSLAPTAVCLQSACTVAFLEAAETSLLAPVAVGAGVSLATVAAIAGAIVVAVVLAKALLTIWTGTPIAIAGLLEYPINYDDNFATFDDWFGSGTTSEYYSSLKLYAQIVTTINTYRPTAFAWDDSKDGALKRAIDQACNAQKKLPQPGTATGCDDGVAVYVPGGTNAYGADMHETSTHIVETLPPLVRLDNPERVKWFYPARSRKNAKADTAGFTPKWYDKAEWVPNECDARFGTARIVCDEFPFRSTNQAGNLSGTRASLRPVPLAEARAQGNDLSGFYSNCKVEDDEEFLVVPFEPWVAARGPSFGVRIGGDNTVSVCQKPSGGR